jgi:hypothetical protein
MLISRPRKQCSTIVHSGDNNRRTSTVDIFKKAKKPSTLLPLDGPRRSVDTPNARSPGRDGYGQESGLHQTRGEFNFGASINCEQPRIEHLRASPQLDRVTFASLISLDKSRYCEFAVKDRWMARERLHTTGPTFPAIQRFDLADLTHL